MMMIKLMKVGVTKDTPIWVNPAIVSFVEAKTADTTRVWMAEDDFIIVRGEPYFVAMLLEGRNP